ncbi:hypothetical protein LTR86_007877 [Recurvomyces mirabilis]|nr:hypothetical protein LTR86_007877 [Recurvomyces mirabilis]
MDLSPAGSSSYTSNTLHVGDGTWDNGRDTFLLPNLMGVNFATMQYNGMGNRFRDLPEYHRLIIGHGVLAALVFMVIVPTAAFTAKFYTRNPRTAIKLHVYLQILTVFLLTVVLVLGYIAVGPARSLSNPHHGIGVAIYVLVLAQFIFGWLMSRIEKRRKNPQDLTRVPKKVWFHRLFGRTIAILGIVQVALGLTLYGSPRYLFILYALVATLLALLYLVMDRVYFEKRHVMFGLNSQPEFYSDYGSYLSGSRTDYGPGSRLGGAAPPMRQQNEGHWGRNVLAGVGALGAYEAFKRRRSNRRDDRGEPRIEEERMQSVRREEREQAEMDAERRNGRPPPGMAPSGVSTSRPGSRPPPGVEYGAGSIATGMGPRPGQPRPDGQMRTPARVRRNDNNRLSPESWEMDEKYQQRPQDNTWRNRILGAGAGIAAFEGVKRVFSGRRKRQEDGYVDDNYRPALGGSHNMVSQTDVSRVEAGQAPFSPDDPRRREHMNMAGVQPMTPTATPSRPPRRPQPDVDSLDYSDDESVMSPRPGGIRPNSQYENTGGDGHTLRNSIATLGAIAGFREWNQHRKDRRERQRLDRSRQDELTNEESSYNRRTSANYPHPQDAGGRRPSMGGTVTTADHGLNGSNPELGRTNFGRPDTMQPPLPATAGAIGSGSGPGYPPSTVGPSISQQRVDQTSGGYSLPPPPAGPPPQGIRQDHLPPPPPGPPPGGMRPNEYSAPEPGSLQMPQGAIYPDPSRLVSSENVVQQSSSGHPIRDAAAGAAVGAAAANIASNHQRRNSQSESPSRMHSRQSSTSRFQRRDRRGSNASGTNSISALNTSVPPVGDQPTSPPVSVKVKMHNDGKHVTLRRLNEEEAAAERAARRAERRDRRRRGSSEISSGLEGDLPPGSNQRYKRAGMGRRPSADQPITNVPPPPPMSSTAGSHRPPSELNLPPTPIIAGPSTGGGILRPATHSLSPQDGQGLSPPPGHAPADSGMTSPGDAGTGTDTKAKGREGEEA